MTRFGSIAFALPMILLAAACSKAPTDAEEDRTVSNETPDIGVSAAPGVAFSYDYRFGLDALKIASLQERHAAACEALGIARCRITGLSFSRNGTDRANASLELALAPDLARKFGRDAIAAVEAARGNVASIEIAGVNQMPAIERSEQDAAAAKTDRAALEADVARIKETDAARTALLQRIAAQREAERIATAQGDAAKRLLATTPMRFTYTTDAFLPGIRLDRTASAALAFASMVLNSLFALLVVLAALAAPVGLGLLALAHGRKQAARLWHWLAPSAEPVTD